MGLTATPYHAHVPSFGEWGFIVAGRRPWVMPSTLPPGLRFLTLDGLPALLRARLFWLYEFTASHSRAVLEGKAEATVLVEINTAVMRGLRGEGATP